MSENLRLTGDEKAQIKKRLDKIGETQAVIRSRSSEQSSKKGCLPTGLRFVVTTILGIATTYGGAIALSNGTGSLTESKIDSQANMFSVIPVISICDVRTGVTTHINVFDEFRAPEGHSHTELIHTIPGGGVLFGGTDQQGDAGIYMAKYGESESVKVADSGTINFISSDRYAAFMPEFSGPSGSFDTLIIDLENPSSEPLTIPGITSTVVSFKTDLVNFANPIDRSTNFMDPRTGQTIAQIAYTEDVFSINSTVDGNKVYYSYWEHNQGGTNAGIYIHKNLSGNTEITLNPETDEKLMDGRLASVSQDGKWLTYLPPRSNETRIVNTETGTERSLKGDVYQLDFTRDGNTIIYSSSVLPYSEYGINTCNSTTITPEVVFEKYTIPVVP